MLRLVGMGLEGRFELERRARNQDYVPRIHPQWWEYLDMFCFTRDLSFVARLGSVG